MAGTARRIEAVYRDEAHDVRFGRRDLHAALLRLTPEEEIEALRYRYVPIAWEPGRTLHVAADAMAERRAGARGRTVIGRVPPGELAAALEAVFGQAAVQEATWGLVERTARFSANRRLVPEQTLTIGLIFAALAAAGLRAPSATALCLAGIGAAGFLAVVALRLFALLPPVRRVALRPVRLAADDLPMYTVLVPLVHETAVLGQLMAGLEAIRYPRAKLDIKLILEESDIETRLAVVRLEIGPPFEVLTVPSYGPQTKPKALNYALAFARGDLVTIFDAEDIPQPRQLLHAAALFAGAPHTTACLQARLAFYNPAENWLTRGIMAQMPQLFGCPELDRRYPQWHEHSRK